jgi:hypothetical protein
MASKYGFAPQRYERLEGRFGLTDGQTRNASIVASITVQVRVALGGLEAKGMEVKIIVRRMFGGRWRRGNRAT